MRFFDLWGNPNDNGDIESYDYLFLGDYVDRGAHSLETVCLLMALTVFVVIIKVVIIITIICTRPNPATNYSFFEKNMCDLLPKPTIQNLQF